ncbi:MAG: hypothetical protein JWR16_1085 [Nevskia sp.]|nr:hypothetical protein [Nevskia sp.]
MISRLLLVILSLSSFSQLAYARENNDPRGDWQELSSKVDVGYKKALQCEAGARKSDRSMCKDFASYMQLIYPRIAYLSSTVTQLPPRQRQKVAPPGEYEDYKVKLNKIAEVSSAWGD